MRQGLSLKARLGLGAGLLGLITLLTAALLAAGMSRVSQRLETALAAETRLEHYAALSTQVSTFIVVAAEVIQRGLPTETRAARIDRIAETIGQTFSRLRAGLDLEVAEARGLDAQSRRATQSLAIARMEALFRTARDGLSAETGEQTRLRAYLDTFASGFEPLLAEAVNEEKRLRNEILAGIEDLRRRLTLAALSIALGAAALSAGFYFGLVRPQFRRLDALRDAARRIGREDFAIALPDGRSDEIGRLSSETERMALALATRQRAVAADRAQLNETIRQRTEALRAANTRLERIDEDRRRFFADISHELRTPLTVILMEAQLGRRGADPAPAFATIETRAQRLNRRIDDLLRIARSETGQLALDTAPVDLAALLQEAIAETQAELSNAGMTVTAPPASPVIVTGDRNWLRQVVVGLIRNAIRHARAGEKLRLALQETDTGGEIALTDNGPGIALEDQAQIFDRFAQGAGGGNAQGFGLGLALARWVIEEQGGSIAVQSPVPRDAALGDAPGTKISVRLPRVPG
ncbi:HAMP domain-containing histidine kinase [Salipiger sp. P9]|uniref:sensor histidine kinase n=1 Tax=Salipiger pentaromativorans TaxID=2943193 RepID=UPI0021588521|nr:HAMP domain-containing sensor histidine kinase [Salipiger pentaromativorans]MCR8548411.1 HAMP domain-containing histidine kinase [Salipiger pentaromativorans]